MHRAVAPRSAIALIVLSIPFAVQATAGDLMDMTVTSKVYAAGMNDSPHASRYTTCVPAAHTDARAMFEQMGCSVSNYRQAGDEVSGRVICPGPPPMSGEGHYTWSGGKFRGQARLTGSANGQTLSADNTVEGRRIGNCDYTGR